MENNLYQSMINCIYEMEAMRDDYEEKKLMRLYYPYAIHDQPG